MTFLTGKSLPRRTVLRGLGASLSLPLLDAMLPAFASRAHAATTRAHRFLAFYVPNGMSELKRLGSDFPYEEFCDVSPKLKAGAA